MKKYIYVDFENVPRIDPMQAEDVKLFLFIGESQKRLSTDTVKAIQPLGKSVEWVQISGSGKNALDFHIAYYLALNEKQGNVEHFVVSKDTGYDPLIEHAKSRGQKAKRVISINDVFSTTNLAKDLNTKYSKVKDGLLKQQKTKRPKSRKALVSSIESILQKQVDTAETEKIIENLFRERIMEEKNRRISYLD
ncbi:MAG: hypothetical protein HN368_12595 [Spirochaetales bacterium]|jgi:hypothetical protein|nr:hypothetical protein [Spirochaetales bacterium]